MTKAKRARQRQVTMTVMFHPRVVRKKWVRRLLESMTLIHAAAESTSSATMAFVARRGPTRIAQLRELADDLRRKNGITAVLVSLNQ